MSLWQTIDKEDITIDFKNKEVSFYVAYDDNGNIYGEMPFDMILDIAEKIKNSK